MARRLLTNRLINRENIDEELFLIYGSDDCYITKSGKIYRDYGNSMFLPKKLRCNTTNGYIYCGISYNGKLVSKRVHKLVAQTFIENPNNCPIVMHIDNNKANNNVDNLKWGTIQENTQQAVNDGLLKNAKGFDDSQSQPICIFNMNHELIDICGSICETSKHYNISKHGIVYQCQHLVKSKKIDVAIILDIKLNLMTKALFSNDYRKRKIKRNFYFGS